MATISMQRDLIATLKTETLLNVGIISKLEPMPPEFSRLVIKENGLEKPTQNLFNNLSYYLVSIIDPQASASLSWPLYDSKTERAYRNELAAFISDYSNRGLISPVMTSYLVNPGSFRVIKLIFQLSQMAVEKLVMFKIKKDSQKRLFTDMTKKYKSQEKDSFYEQIERETNQMLSKLSNYLLKRKAMKEIAEKFHKTITGMELKLSSMNAQKFLDNLVDEFISQNDSDCTMKTEILKIKDIRKPCQFFDIWLLEVDKQIDDMESKWIEKVSPFIQTCKDTRFSTESLIARHTGAADKDSYMIEYNHKTDEICTDELQNLVNSEQKYILKNMVKNETLNFPNLIRSFLIAICFILKNMEIGDEIYKFNEYLESGKGNYREIVKSLRQVVERVMNADALLEPSPISYHSLSVKTSPELPPLPDLSDLKSTRELQCQVMFDSFTPLSMSKHQFNLHRRSSLHTFAKPQSKSMFVTPHYKKPKEDFLKSLISCRVSSYDHLNSTQNFNNISSISQVNRPNETISECSTGFTKHQMLRLLSTKKSSSSKKFKYKTDRMNSAVKKGALFNETNSSNESNGLYRSYSSPNLFENRESRPFVKARHRKLSIMQENSPSPLEVSGIAVLDQDSSCSTIKDGSLKTPSNLNIVNIPTINITSVSDEKFHKNIKDFNIDLNKEILIEDVPKIPPKEIEIKTITPKTNTQLVRKTSSLEKIINRFKKVRANVLPEDEQTAEFRTIVEEKEHMNINFDFANRILLPDLLSPSCSVINKTVDFLSPIEDDDDMKVKRKARESLGTALGVDQTFLDQFDLID